MITLTGNPKSTQHIYRYACRGNFPTMYMTAEGTALKEQYFWEVKSQWRKKVITSPVTIEVTLYFGDKRKRDIDNFNKLILDAMSGVVWKDDSQITEMKTSKRYDKDKPRVEIIIHSQD